MMSRKADVMSEIRRFLMTHSKRIIALVLVCAFFICSMTVLADIFTNPQTYSKTVRSIDQKKVTVLGVSAAIAGSATLLAAVPDDATTPLAEEMMDLSSYLVFIICVLVLEKSLLTAFGGVSCYVLFPISCLLVIAYIIKNKRIFMSWAIKIASLALVLLAIVPVSIKFSDYVYEINQVSIEEEVEEIVAPEETEEELPWYTKLWNNITETVKNTAEMAVESGKSALNKFIDAVSVFIIAYCAIPVCVVFLLLWLLKILFGLDINIDALIPRRHRRKEKEIDFILEEQQQTAE